MADARLFSAACERNRDPILEVLRAVLPARALVLEIGSGSGMHGAWFVPRLPGVVWQPTDASAEALASIAAWRETEPSDRLLSPLRLDVLEARWPVARADAVFSANVIHISPWECTVALVGGAAALLPPGAPLVLYGPFRVGGAHTAPSNERFDARLRSEDPRWGVRDLEAVEQVARAAGFALDAVHPLPANNQVVVLRRAGDEGTAGGSR